MSDPYSRLDYRRMVAWPRRIEREAPLLLDTFGPPAGRRLLDLGCGSGEHARFLAARGFEVVGVDASPSMLELATAEPLPPGLRFVEADLEDLGDAVAGRFDGALCLGNTLPHLRTRKGLSGFLSGLRRRLAPGAPLLAQLLNYERVFELGLRHLPLNFRPHDEGEIVFLRLMKAHDDGRVSFVPSSLLLDPERDPPLELRSAKRIELQGWRRDELERALKRAGFETIVLHGGFDRAPFAELESVDLVVIAR